MSRLLRRLGRSMSSVLVGVLTIALLGALGTSLAFAAPASASTNTAQGAGYKHPKPTLTCDPKDPHLFGGCQLKFKDITDPQRQQGPQGLLLHLEEEHRDRCGQELFDGEPAGHRVRRVPRSRVRAVVNHGRRAKQRERQGQIPHRDRHRRRAVREASGLIRPDGTQQERGRPYGRPLSAVGTEVGWLAATA